MEWKVFVDTTKAGNEVILPGADGAFGSIAAVQAGNNELVVDVLLGQVEFEFCGAFIVKSVVGWAEASSAHAAMNFLESSLDALSCTVLEGHGEDGVAVPIVANHLVIVALAGGSNEFAGLIGVDLASGLHVGNEAGMCKVQGTAALWGKEIILGCLIEGVGLGGWLSLGRSAVLSDLVQVALDRSTGARWMLT